MASRIYSIYSYQRIRSAKVNASFNFCCATFSSFFEPIYIWISPRRPVIGSAFTAYVPGKAGSGANTRGSPAKQYTGLDNLRSRTSYLTSLGAGEER